jgi:hypothetical protein
MKTVRHIFAGVPLAVAAAGLWLLLANAASADDGAMEGEGGSLHLMSAGHPSVTMANEVVRIDGLPKGHVRARFVFKNHGPACDVKMGFPDQSWGDGHAGGGFEGFRSWVDGREVRTQFVEGTNPDPSQALDWWVKRVHFNRGQTRVVEDEYFGGGGYDSSGNQFIMYELDTGDSWKGPIGRGRIVVDVSGLPYGAPQMPDNFVRHGSTFVWRFTNLHPDRADNVDIVWKPCYADVTVNGTRVRADDQMGWFAQRRGPEVWLPTKLAASWLGGELKEVSRGRYRIIRANRWVDFRTWSNQLTSSSGAKIVMPYRVTIDGSSGLPEDARPRAEGQQYHTIGLLSLVRALGGEAHFDPSGISLIVTLPKSSDTANT